MLSLPRDLSVGSVDPASLKLSIYPQHGLDVALKQIPKDSDTSGSATDDYSGILAFVKRIVGGGGKRPSRLLSLIPGFRKRASRDESIFF